MNYYNENDQRAAAWLRELMWENLVPLGEVDERSVVDVRPADLVGFKQCHFFAGIGGWAYALRLAGWPDDEPVWTGSCPCQPFSRAGRQGGTSDDRHLYPTWSNLIRQCRPPVIFGEQVANSAGLAWYDAVADDLESQGYAVGAADLSPAALGAPHRRQRLFFVGDSGCDGGGRIARAILRTQGGTRGEVRGVTDVPLPPSDVGDAHGAGLEGRGVSDSGRPDKWAAWSPSNLVWCRDGKWRPVEPGTFPLVNGVPGRVGLLRGYGNAIVPALAAAFIRAATEK